MIHAESMFPQSDPDLDRFGRYLMGYFGQHLVALGIQYEEFDEQGKSRGVERFLAVSGFVMAIRDIWFVVTAGHVFQELDSLLAAKRIRISNCAICDYMGKNAKVALPTPISYEDTPKQWVHDDEYGLDLGLMPLRLFYREGLIANGVKPICEENWVHQHKVEFERFFLVGFPKVLVDQHTQQVPVGDGITARLPTIIISVDQITDPAKIPTSVEMPNSQLPWFIGRLAPDNVPNIKGMSGGPIIGVVRTPEGGLRYWVVALQSGWYEESRIIRGCPVPVFAELVGRELDEYLTQES